MKSHQYPGLRPSAESDARHWPACFAAERLNRLDYDGVAVKVDDGHYGSPEHGAYKAILVKEALEHVPEPLLPQLKSGGRMVVPIGPAKGAQELTLIEKDDDGKVRRRNVLPGALLAPPGSNGSLFHLLPTCRA